MKILNMQELVLLNQYVQGVVSRHVIYEWFLCFEEADKQSLVKSTWILATQAQFRESDIPVATLSAKLKPTNTPIVMVTKCNVSLNNRGYKLSVLKGTVLDQAFWFVLECLALAERRRKEEEDVLKCNHWWHKDLSNELVVKKILDNI